VWREVGEKNEQQNKRTNEKPSRCSYPRHSFVVITIDYYSIPTLITCCLFLNKTKQTKMNDKMVPVQIEKYVNAIGDFMDKHPTTTMNGACV
jgi:hypothetical protein